VIGGSITSNVRRAHVIETEVTERLMATGAGYTTLCEVVVMPADTNKFEIEPYPREEVEQTIADFCLTIWKKAHPDGRGEGENAGDQVNFPPELVRAVRNMVKLPDGDKREDDAAIHLAIEFPANGNGFEQFRAHVLGLAKLDGRTLTEFNCPPNVTDVRAWIKKTFDDLNLARLDTVSIPRRITFRVDANLLTQQMAHIESVVDTKGVDAAQFNREDLDRYIRKD
jgi:hypothetical protein